MQRAVDELRSMIQEQYPSATFRVGPSPEDPAVIHLTATVDVEDTDAVLDVVNDRMREIQIEDRLPLFVIPVRPAERVIAMRRAVTNEQHVGPQTPGSSLE